MTLLDWPYVRRVLSPSEIPTKNLLLLAIMRVESSYDPNAVRHEPGFKDVWNIDRNAKELGISNVTEETFQKTSWGLGQIMGGTARWLGYHGPLTGLLDVQTNIIFSEALLQRLLERYNQNISKAVAAYNKGNARHCSDDACSVDEYVQKVKAEYNMHSKYNIWPGSRV